MVHNLGTLIIKYTGDKYDVNYRASKLGLYAQVVNRLGYALIVRVVCEFNIFSNFIYRVAQCLIIPSATTLFISTHLSIYEYAVKYVG